MKKDPYSDQQKRVAKKMYYAGDSFKDIARAIGVCKGSAMYLTTREGWHVVTERVLFNFDRAKQHMARSMLADGKRIRDLAEHFGVTYHWMKQTLAKMPWYKIDENKKQPPLSKQESDKARKLIKEGILFRDIAKMLGRTSTKKFVRRLARKFGWLHEIDANPKWRSGMYKLLERKIAAMGISKRDYYDYRTRCRILAKHAYKDFAHVIDPRGLRGINFHVDHRFSVADGLINYVDPMVVSHPANLRVITSAHNMSKNSKSSISLRRLLADIREFERRHGIFSPNSEYHDASNSAFYAVSRTE